MQYSLALSEQEKSGDVALKLEKLEEVSVTNKSHTKQEFSCLV